MKLQLHTIATFSGSGTISEESNILNFPALNIREAHQQPEVMEEGAAMMTGLQVKRSIQGLCILEAQSQGATRLLRAAPGDRLEQSDHFREYRADCL